MKDACGLDQVVAVEVVQSGCTSKIKPKWIRCRRERVKDGSKVWGPNNLKDGATFNREEKDKGRTDQEFSSGYSEFEIRLSHEVLKRQPDRKLWRL